MKVSPRAAVMLSAIGTSLVLYLIAGVGPLLDQAERLGPTPAGEVGLALVGAVPLFVGPAIAIGLICVSIMRRGDGGN